MIYFWLFQIASLLFVLVSRNFFDAFLDTDILILSLLILIFTPVIIPVVAIIREDMTPMRSISTPVGVSGLIIILLLSLWVFVGQGFSIGIFVLVALFAIYFRLESRIFFLGALLGLIVTVSALLIEKSSIAESSSIIVYLLLVIGVFVEIGSPWFERFHSRSKSLIHIPPEFKIGYQQALSEYAWMMTLGIQSLFTIAFMGRGMVWNFEYQMLLYLAFGVWIFFILYLLSIDRTLSIQDFIRLRFSRRYIHSIFREIQQYIKYVLIGIVLLVLISMINWSLIWGLPIVTLFSLITLIFLCIGVSVYGIIVFFYRR